MLYLIRKNNQEIVITLPDKRKVTVGIRIMGNKVQFSFDNKWVDVENKK